MFLAVDPRAHKLSKLLFFCVILLGLITIELQAQVTGDYRSNAASFNWDATASWQRWDGSTWVSNPAQGYPGQNASGIAGTVTILNAHTVTLNVSPAQSIGTLVISSGGTFAAGAQTLQISNSFTNNGGTFTQGTSTIIFNGTGSQSINGTVATQSFANITVNKANGTLSVGGSTTTLNVVAYTQTLGDFNAPATFTATGNVVLSAGNFTAGANVNIGGTTASLTNNGATFNAGSGTLTFNGTGAQAINGSATAQTFNNLVINKSGGTALTVGGSTTTLNVANLTRTLGNFTAPATLNVSGSITLTAGTFTAGANTNLGGDFTNNGGTFTPGSNTVTFNGTAAQAINGTATSQTFNDIVVNKPSGTLSVGGSTTSLTVASLTLTAGNFTAPTTLNITNTFTNNSGGFSAGTNTVAFTSTGTKNISGSSSTTFHNLTMNTGGSAALNLNVNIQINGALTWSADGLIIPGTNNITMGSSATFSGANTNRYIQQDATEEENGQVIRINNNTVAAWQLLFPVGTATGGYTPVDLTGATITTAPSLNSTLAVKAIYTTSSSGRLRRIFRFIVAGNSNATQFSGGTFAYNSGTDVSSGPAISTYTALWFQRASNGVWTNTGSTSPVPPSATFAGPSSSQNLTNDTYFFTIASPTGYGTTWYSYQSGNWNDPLTWTTDGGVFPLYVNPTNSVPTSGDNVVITSGRTVTMNVNSVTITSMNVIGTLDMAATTGHNFTTISGSGKIKIAGSTDNFPSGTATNFADNAVGGTLEVNGSGMQLNVARTFNHVIINMTGSSDAAIIKNTLTTNGDLTISNGLLQFENTSTPANRTVTINGHVSVASTGGIRVASSNNRHQFNLYGNFDNNGTAYFTNRTIADVANEATDGIVDVNFLSSTRDQQVVCNGVTRFYRIEIDKGTDDTYKASISASASANFNLFGRANYDINSASGANNNALGLIAGTAEIGTNVSLLLNNANNYAIFTNARLWVNGGTVTKSGNAIVPYGAVRVSSGLLSSDGVGGVTIRDAGALIVEGGTVSLTCIRTSTNGASAQGSYVQSGGTVTLTGTTINTDYAVFSLTYSGNVFNMSGGTLIVQTRPSTSTTRGTVFINSDPANVNVTGGTVIFEADNTVPYRVTSRAAFWNLIMRGTGAVRTLELLGTTSGDPVGGGPPDEIELTIQPLVVLNDFTIENNASFTTNNADVTIGGNFEIQSGGVYTHGTNTTTINNAGVSSLVFGNITTTQSFNNLTINKTSSTDEVVIVSGRPGPVNSAIQVNSTFAVTNGVFDYGTFIASAQGTVTLASTATVGKSGSTGRLVMNGTVDQTIATSGASVYNLEINNTDASPQVSLSTGNLTVLGTLTLTNGLLDINTRRLTLNGSTALISGSGFGTTKMIQLAGNAGDGGLEMYFDANESITFPIGTGANSTVRYTPVVAQTQSLSDDGLIRISIEDRLLQLANLPATNSLSYNWRVNISNFTTLPLVSYQFSYAQSDADGSEAAYEPGKVLTTSPYTRSAEAGSDINTTTNVLTFNGTSTGSSFPGAGFTLENAAYTAGQGMFSGTPQVFYNLNTSQTGWEDNNKWSLISHTGTATNQSPAAGDVVMMRNFGETNGNAWVNMDVDVEVAAVIFDNSFGGWSPRITVQNGRTVSLGVVSGTGTIMVEANGSLPNLTTTDIGSFARQDASVFIYKVENDATYNMYSTISEYPTLRIEGNDGGNNNGLRVMTNSTPVIINRDLWMDWGGTFRAGNTVTIVRDMLPGQGGGGGGRFQFGEGGSYSVTVGRNISSTNSANNRIEVLNTTPSTRNHTLSVAGDITLTTGLIDLYNGSGATANQATLQLTSTTTGSFTNSSGNTPDLYRLIVNKGSSISSTFTLSDNVTLNGPFDGTIKPLTLVNGLLIMDDPALSFTLTSGGADFNIPSTAGLEVRQGAAATNTTSTNANLTLDGLLRVSGGSVTINGGGAADTNYIEYSNSGSATIEVTSGSLTVAGQVRRSLLSSTGILKYTQSGGSVIVGNEAAPTTTRGVFEVLNTGSQFNHSGGSFTIVRSNTSATIPSLLLEPASSSVTSGSTITIGNGVTFTNFGIQSSIALNNLTISGATGSVTRIYVSPLTVNNVLTLSANNTLNAQNIDLTIGGNFVVNGTYTPGTNTTTFSNGSAAAISGTTTPISFYNFTKNNSGTLSLSQNINVTRDLKVSAGTLATGASSITLTRHAEIDATITSTSGSGLIFGGTAQQQLTRSGVGTGTMGIVTINNSTGVIIPDGNGYDFNITSDLRLQSGVFDIGGSLLTLGTTATITPVSTFSVTNMIQTNSSFTDKGVRKQFPTSSSPAFVFPVGQSYYTPVTFSAGSTGSSGSPTITVRPANRRHPTVINNDEAGELPTPALFNDLDNVLQYYWIVSASNIANSFSSTMTLQYVQPLVKFAAPDYSESDYIAARILTDPIENPSLLINKFSTAEVNESANTITFSFSGVTQAGIAGEYFAGIPIAIPNSVPIYTTQRSGNVDGTGGVGNLYNPTVPGGGVPNGARVVVSNGHVLTFNTNSVNLYETQINSGGTVLIPSGSIGHSLGNLSGTGNLQIESNTGSAVLPAAVYDDFLSCSGGGLIFGGSGTYEVLGGITSVRNLTLTGTGAKSLANNDIIICNNLTIDNGSFTNAGNQTITVQNDVLHNAGIFYNQNGTLSITRDLIQTSGTFDGGTGGQKTIGRNLTVNGGTFTPGSGSSNIIRVNGNMTIADAATITTGLGGVTGQRFTFGGSSAQTLTGTFTGTRAFNRLEINNSSGLSLAGNTTIESEMLLTNGVITPGSSSLLMSGNAIATPTAGSATSFVNGKLFKTITAAGSDFTFPIGSGTRWRTGAVLAVSVGGVTWDMQYIGSAATGAIAAAPAPRNNAVSNFTSADPLVLRIATGEHWRVSDGSSSSNGRTARVGLSWGIDSQVSTNLAQREAMKVMSWNGTNWTNNGGTNFQPGGAHTQTRGTFESTATLSFSENIVTLGSTETANPLPVELVKFSGKSIEEGVQLDWTTASELNNDYFDVQRSADGYEFYTIGKIEGKGTTNQAQQYQFLDEQVTSGKWYYRLKQVDFDGKSGFSSIVAITRDQASATTLSIYPNPSRSGMVTFRISSDAGDSAQVVIFDGSGKLLFKQVVPIQNGFVEVVPEIELAQGIHFVEVMSGFSRVVKRLVIID